MLAAAALVAVALGYALGGRLSRAEECALRALPLPIFAYILQAAAQGLSSRIAWDRISFLVIPLSYGLIFLFLGLNWKYKKTALFFGAGSVCNLLVIACNGFRMPLGQQAAQYLSPEKAAALLAGEIPLYVSAQVSNRLLFLGDVICVPGLGAASAGDMLLVAGLFFCVMALMAPTRPRRLQRFWAAG